MTRHLNGKSTMQILGAIAPGAPSGIEAVKAKAQGKKNADMSHLALYEGVPWLVGGALGALLWKKHRVLGFIGGSSVGAAAYPLYSGQKRVEAITALGVVAGGVAASLHWKQARPIFGRGRLRTPRGSVLGYLGGAVVAGAVGYGVTRAAGLK